ncbi:MAG: tRNA pseudouridine(55) synthase TruB [Pseudomonadota bacterium]|nr:tRNA pseudouridine(55) synthase TruB [Pseudomonadota bacterium]
MMHGWIILDKPSGITSAHAVAKVKRLLRPKKIGHAGTLDPLASGVLPLALGEATKTVPYMMDADKAYEFTATWGEERDTDDSEGRVTATAEKRPTQEEINIILQHFTGKILQTPPVFSAIKVAGERAYDLARDGKVVELKAREIEIKFLTLLGRTAPFGADNFICHCSKGTYIRSLARDMGRELGCFGHISRLRRIKVGKFTETQAISLEILEEMVHKSDLGFLRPLESALDDIPAYEVDSDQAMLLMRGQPLHLPTTIAEEPESATALARHQGKAVAICGVSRGVMRPVRVFNN